MNIHVSASSLDHSDIHQGIRDSLSRQPQLPRKPEHPLDSDCCGQGCVPCVLDLYEEELDIWKEECQRILSGKPRKNETSAETEQITGPVLSVTEYRSFQIQKAEKETEDSFRFRFSLPQGVSLGLKTGQHIVIRGEVDGELVTRQYTPISDVSAKSYFDVLIKVYVTGRLSRVVRTWSAGTTVDIRGPCGSLSYSPNKYRMVYMLAVGTGIAPMAQVIQTILNNEDDETVIKLLYGCRTYQDILMKAELTEWRKYWNFSQLYCLSQESKNDQPAIYKYGERIHNGRIMLDILRKEVSSPLGDSLILICGTRSFEKDMIICMSELGVDKDHFHKF